jgi:drug/metabolite transporter (DMT)-like permease
VKDDGYVADRNEVPLNLKVHRAEFARIERRPSRQKMQALGLLVSGVLLLVASRRRGRYVVPAAAALATGSLAALATALLANRRRGAREARIDERIEQSFPASDPAGV